MDEAAEVGASEPTLIGVLRPCGHGGRVHGSGLGVGGPIVGGLADRFGQRIVGIGAAVLVTFALAVTVLTMAPDRPLAIPMAMAFLLGSGILARRTVDRRVRALVRPAAPHGGRVGCAPRGRDGSRPKGDPGCVGVTAGRPPKESLRSLDRALCGMEE